MRKAFFTVVLLCAATAGAQDEVVLNQIAAIDLPDWSGGCVVENQLAYVAGGNAGLLIFDVSDPLNPTLIGSRDSLGGAGKIQLSPPYAYVGSGAVRIYIIDVSNPATPAVVGLIADDGWIADFDIRGQYLYLSQSAGMRIVNITDPVHPTTISLLPLSSEPAAIAAEDDFVLHNRAQSDGALYVIGVSDPVQPHVMANLAGDPESPIYDIDFHNHIAYLTSGGPWGSSFAALDVSNPAAPEWLSDKYSLMGDWFVGGGLDVAGTYAYWSRFTGGIEIIDISNPRSLHGVGAWQSETYFGFEPCVAGAYVFDAWTDSLRVLHIYFRARGNVNYDSKLDAADVISLVNYVFRSGPPPQPEAYVGDTDCDTMINTSDILRMVAYLFKGAPKPLCN